MVFTLDNGNLSFPKGTEISGDESQIQLITTGGMPTENLTVYYKQTAKTNALLLSDSNDWLRYDASMLNLKDNTLTNMYMVQNGVKSQEYAVDLSNLTVGVGEILTEGADDVPVFYDLSGLRVERPTGGIYIMVKGGKALKVIINQQ